MLRTLALYSVPTEWDTVQMRSYILGRRAEVRIPDYIFLDHSKRRNPFKEEERDSDTDSSKVLGAKETGLGTEVPILRD